jgi:hypothetical protein
MDSHGFLKEKLPGLKLDKKLNSCSSSSFNRITVLFKPSPVDDPSFESGHRF